MFIVTRIIPEGYSNGLPQIQHGILLSKKAKNIYHKTIGFLQIQGIMYNNKAEQINCKYVKNLKIDKQLNIVKFDIIDFKEPIEGYILIILSENGETVILENGQTLQLKSNILKATDGKLWLDISESD